MFTVDDEQFRDGSFFQKPKHDLLEFRYEIHLSDINWGLEAKWQDFF